MTSQDEKTPRNKPNSETLHLVRSLRRILSTRLGVPVKVKLFGSQARGTATEESDIDVLVVLPDLRNCTLDTALEAAWEVGFNGGKVISIVPATKEELQQLSASPFFQAVAREGFAV